MRWPMLLLGGAWPLLRVLRRPLVPILLLGVLWPLMGTVLLCMLRQPLLLLLGRGAAPLPLQCVLCVLQPGTGLLGVVVLRCACACGGLLLSLVLLWSLEWWWCAMGWCTAVLPWRRWRHGAWW